MAHPAPTPPPYREDWRDQAQCRDLYDLYDAATEGAQAAVDATRAICSGCSSRAACLTDGIREPYGVRAGLDAPERDPLARAYAAHLAAVARLDSRLREIAAGDPGLREALTALSVEGDAVAAAALAVAAGAGTGEVHAALEVALDAQAATSAALDELHVARPAGLDQAATTLMAAAMTVAATASAVPAIAAVA